MKPRLTIKRGDMLPKEILELLNEEFGEEWVEELGWNGPTFETLEELMNEAGSYNSEQDDDYYNITRTLTLGDVRIESYGSEYIKGHGIVCHEEPADEIHVYSEKVIEKEEQKQQKAKLKKSDKKWESLLDGLALDANNYYVIFEELRQYEFPTKHK